jgi:hypothetical protein
MNRIIFAISIILIGLFIGCSGLNHAIAKRDKVETPKGLKTKTEVRYDFVKKSGKYKKVLDTKRVFRYNNNGNAIENALYDANSKLIEKSLFKYDDNGNQIEEDCYNADDRLTDKWFSKYDDKGNQIESLKYDVSDKLIGKHLNKYDDNGNQIEHVVYDGYKWYDDHLIEHVRFRVTKSSSKYDNKGNEIETIHYDDDGKLWGKKLNKYANNDNLIESLRTFYDHDGKLTGKCLYNYYDKGNRLESFYYDADGKLINKGLCKYKYDEKGNLIEKTISEIYETPGQAEEIPFSQTVWEYEFYPEPENK